MKWGSFVSKYVFNLSIFNLKTLLQLFANNFQFSKISFKVKVLEMFKIFFDYHIKACPSLKQIAILKITPTAF